MDFDAKVLQRLCVPWIISEIIRPERDFVVHFLQDLQHIKHAYGARILVERRSIVVDDENVLFAKPLPCLGDPFGAKNMVLIEHLCPFLYKLLPINFLEPFIARTGLLAGRRAAIM